MTWTAPERPDWVRAVNAGAIPPIAAEARRPFTVDGLLAEARTVLGLADGGVVHDFGDDAFVEPLAILARSLEDDAQLTVIGRWAARRHLLRLLEVKAQMASWVRGHPAVVDEVIERPVFIAGAPRTGTTVLHGLLAQDYASRVPLGWELLRPVPALPAGEVDEARVELTEAELRLPTSIVSTIDAIHVYGARLPKECLSAMAFAFRSEEFVARYRVPAYERWLQQCDMTPAYAAHRLVLQLLQSRSPRPRWVLKSPVHLQSLGALWATYPDATLIVTHRDPLTVLASVTSLLANLRWAHSDHVDFAELGRYHADLYARSLTALAEGTDVRGPVHHVAYADLVADPIGVIAALYDGLGWTLDDGTATAMRAHLADRPKDQHGEHRYSFADLGPLLDADVERARFRRYLDRFGVPEEAITP